MEPCGERSTLRSSHTHTVATVSAKDLSPLGQLRPVLHFTSRKRLSVSNAIVAIVFVVLYANPAGLLYSYCELYPIVASTSIEQGSKYKKYLCYSILRQNNQQTIAPPATLCLLSCCCWPAILSIRSHILFANLLQWPKISRSKPTTCAERSLTASQSRLGRSLPTVCAEKNGQFPNAKQSFQYAGGPGRSNQSDQTNPSSRFRETLATSCAMDPTKSSAYTASSLVMTPRYADPQEELPADL